MSALLARAGSSCVRPLIALAALAAAAASPVAAQDFLSGGIYDAPEVREYRLTLEGLERYAQATHAVEAADLEIEDDAIEDDADITFAQVLAVFESDSAARAAVEGAGMSSSEYLAFTFSLMRAMFGSLLFEFGGEEALAELDDPILADNIRFLVTNKDAIDAFLATEDAEDGAEAGKPAAGKSGGTDG